MNPRLSPRLARAKEMCADALSGEGAPGGEKAVLADVGCDHALLGAALLCEGAASFCICSDLREGPLLRAAENAERFGVSERMRIVRADGLSHLAPHEAQVVSILGVGGELIVSMLGAADLLALGIRRLILSPHTKAQEVRRFLYEEGFLLEEEALVREDDKLYTLLSARMPKEPSPGRDEIYAKAKEALSGEGALSKEEALETLFFTGPHLFLQRDPLMLDMLCVRERRLSEIANGLPGTSDGEDRGRLEQSLRMIRAAIACAAGEKRIS